MQKRKFDELISYFNRKVAEMDISTNYKMELLGMVTALELAHEKETEGRKTGRWIENEYEHDRELWDAETKCSLCGYVLGGAKPNFCPNCGARMKP